jgi:hypothetical protein
MLWKINHLKHNAKTLNMSTSYLFHWQYKYTCTVSPKRTNQFKEFKCSFNTIKEVLDFYFLNKDDYFKTIKNY